MILLIYLLVYSIVNPPGISARWNLKLGLCCILSACSRVPGWWETLSKYWLDESVDESGNSRIPTQVCLCFRKINVTCEKIPTVSNPILFVVEKHPLDCSVLWNGITTVHREAGAPACHHWHIQRGNKTHTRYHSSLQAGLGESQPPAVVFTEPWLKYKQNGLSHLYCLIRKTWWGKRMNAKASTVEDILPGLVLCSDL